MAVVGKIWDIAKGDVPASASTLPFDPQADSTTAPNGVNAGKTPKVRLDSWLGDIGVDGKPTAA
jgi:hypothetical protein